jgi:hypothetical protein
LPDEFYIKPTAVEGLAKEFRTRAEDLGEQLAKFKPKTDGEAIHDGFGVLTESEEVTSAYIDLADKVRDSVEGLQKHLDAIADGLKKNASNTEKSDETMENLFKGR